MTGVEIRLTKVSCLAMEMLCQNLSKVRKSRKDSKEHVVLVLLQDHDLYLVVIESQNRYTSYMTMTLHCRRGLISCKPTSSGRQWRKLSASCALNRVQAPYLLLST